MADKRSKLAEYFGLEELPPLTMADGVMRGIGRMSDQASEALGPLGAKLDAKLGTVGKPREGNYPQDPLLPAEPPVPQNRRGLFETLGAGVPQIAGFVAGNEVPMAGPIAPRGSVAAFPSPKQSFKAMQDEAVLRDMLEAKGARPIEAPRLWGVSPKPLEGGLLDKAGNRRPHPDFDSSGARFRQSDAAQANHEQRITDGFNRGGEDLLGRRIDDWRDVGVESEHMASAPEVYRGQVHRSPIDELPRASERIALPAEQTELEKYLAGLYGPKAK